MIFESALITGCGGDIALSIASILRDRKQIKTLHGTDITEDHPGAAFYDRCDIVPRADAVDYIEALSGLVSLHGINVVIPVSEPEIRFFTLHNIDNIAGVPLVMADMRSRTIGFDKYATARFLEEHGLDFPWTIPVSEAPPRELPCIVKSRTGSGSRDVRIVEQELVEHYTRKKHDAIWQELLLPEDEEYTCGVYRTLNDETRTIAFKRRLVGGHTGQAVTCNRDDIGRLLTDLAVDIDLRGSINIQLRLTARGPVVFEINPRFSSTVSFRHTLGFTDLIWSLQEIAGEKVSDYSPPEDGIRIFRVSKEIYEFPTKAEHRK